MADILDSLTPIEIDKSVVGFYWKCYMDPNAKDEYYDLMAASLVLYGDALTEDEKKAIEEGSAGLIRTAANGNRRDVLVQFFDAVAANTTLTGKFQKLHDELLAKYGGQLDGGDKNGPLHKLIREGDARRINNWMKKECAGIEDFLDHTWSLKCSLDV